MKNENKTVGAKGMARKVDELGRVTLPKPMRVTLGIHTLDNVDIYLENNRLVIVPLRTGCQCCGGEDALISYNSITLCRDCVYTFLEIPQQEEEGEGASD